MKLPQALTWLLAAVALATISCSGRSEISADTVFRASDNPHVFDDHLTIESGVTLTIEAGVRIELGDRVKIRVRGRLVAKGTTAEKIVFTRQSEDGKWGRMDFQPSSMVSHLEHVELRHVGETGAITAYKTKLHLDHVTWVDTNVKLLHVARTSVVVRDCTFPSIRDEELFRFEGMPSDGYAVIERNTFGTTTGYNDIVDFTGGKRPGPIPQFLDNVFTGAVDDCLDLDGTDAHIEGNVFMNVQNPVDRESSCNAIATGSRDGNVTELVIARNLFYNCDHALLLKFGARAVLQNNTIVKIGSQRASAEPPSVLNFDETNRKVSVGRGAVCSGNIFWDLGGHPLVRNFDAEKMSLIVEHCIFEGNVWPGRGNSAADPLFVKPVGITAENIRSRLALRPESPAVDAGPNGLDVGALVPAGASISGEPEGITSSTTATLMISGPGITAFKYRLDEGALSEEIAIEGVLAGHRLELTGLSAGPHQVFVSGKNSADAYQRAPTRSRIWTVR